MKNLLKYTLLAVNLIVMQFFVACNSKPDVKPANKEDVSAKKQLQGTWINELEGNIVFSFRGDSVFYNDSLSSPAVFRVFNDTLFIENHPLTAYPLKKLDSSNLCFINMEGDETSLIKADKNIATLMRGEYKGTVALNQGKKVKEDTVMVYNGKHYHAYTQVNPTTFKVYKQNVNSDGLRVENVYYDNIVYIAFYEGQRKLYGSNITKSDFSKLVPQTYLEQAVLSEINVDRVGDKGVRFIAVLTIPDTYTNYRVNIDIDLQGKKTLSV